MSAWGWRIPFVIGALLSVTALYLRTHMQETSAFEHLSGKAKKEGGSLRELMHHPRAVATVVGLTLGGTIAFYTYTTYMQKFLVNTVHLTKSQSTLITFLSLFIYAMLQPLFGLLSDKIGRRPLLLGFGILGTLCTVPLLYALAGSGSQWEAFVWMMLALLIVSGYTSINAVVKAEMFPAEIRALGVGFPYSVTVALFGGTAEYVALWFKGAGMESGYYWYVATCVLISLLVYSTMKDTRDNSAMDKDA
jgi:MHS family alpha-ketoglutarate permease-like MFS transporter